MEVFHSDAPAVQAGEALAALLASHKDRPVLLLLSGGSAFSLLAHVSDEVLGPHVTLSVLDERFSVDEEVNNFAQLERTSFYNLARARGARIINTKVVDGDTLRKAGEKFEVALRTWREKNRDGVVFATMGMGPDGHTAGIFPGVNDVLFDGNQWVVAYEVLSEINLYTERFTVTNTFLVHEVAVAVVYVVGAEKKLLLEDITSGQCDSKKTPACIWRQLPLARVFTD